jgi:hypothetical protein
VRTRRENAARKGLRRLNAQKQAKAALLPPKFPKRAEDRSAGGWQPEPGQRFGMLVALERGDDYIHPKGDAIARWWFVCDCGERVLWRPTTVRSNAERGWCSCPACYRQHCAELAE